MSKSKFTHAKRCVSMSAVLQDYLGDDTLQGYKQSGDQLRGPCLICEKEKGNSLSINTAKNCFRTFCCDKQGNIFDFVAAVEDVSINDALVLIIKRFDVGDEMSGHSDKETSQTIQDQSNISNEPLSFELKNIDHGHENVKILDISEDTATRFGVGHYSGRGMFNDQVVFPIHNNDCALIGYAGIDDQGKWHYPEKFNREVTLYNLHRAQRSLNDRKASVAVVNTPLDVLRLYPKDVNAIATMSDLISDQQVDYISQLMATGIQQSTNHVLNDTKASYGLGDAEILARGADILSTQMKKGDVFKDFTFVLEFLKRKIALQDREVFGCLYLDSRNHLIAFDELFKGTVKEAIVFPREVARQALLHNATSIIVAHNHPAHTAKPSKRDKELTEKLREYMRQIDIPLLDHIVVGGNCTYSFAEHGWL